MTPRPRLTILFAIGIVAAVAGSLWEPARTITVLWNLLVLAVAAVDLTISIWPGSIGVVREEPRVFAVGVASSVTLTVRNRAERPITVEILDDIPHPGRATGLPLTVEDLEPDQVVDVQYRYRPEHRGRYHFGDIHLRISSRLGLWNLLAQHSARAEIRVYPDLRTVGGQHLLAKRNLLQEMGLKHWRMRGQGGEFERLREYRIDDEMRQIDWKATAKFERLVSREYNVERNQNLVFLLDSGASMANEFDGVSNLDRALNAAITLSYIGLEQGDNVAFFAFSNRLERAVRPVRGRSAIQHIIRACFDLAPSEASSDYTLACEELLKRQRKRSLVILITHTLAEQHTADIRRLLTAAMRPHLVLCAFIQDPTLEEFASRVPSGEVEAFQVAGAAEILASQARAVAELRDAGALVVECLPEQLTSGLINRYLEVKAGHQL